MARLTHSRPTRWAAGDGGLSSPSGAEMTEEEALEAMPETGLHLVELDGESFEVERVGSRYCSVADVRDAAARNNDDFADVSKYPDSVVLDAIQAAEEAIEAGCGRSFCERAASVAIPAATALFELPEQDVRSLAGAELVTDRQAANPSGAPVLARMVYGARGDEGLRRACAKLASSYLRPRAGAENARGASVDGVYVSFELATGADGSWTGIPEVDAAIESRRSRRRVIG